MATFAVHGNDGPIQAEQLATFAYYVQNIQFRFVVTRLPGCNVAVVTHRASGKRVTDVPHMLVLSALRDYAAAGRRAMDLLVQKHGEARVRSVLAAAEATTA